MRGFPCAPLATRSPRPAGDGRWSRRVAVSNPPSSVVGAQRGSSVPVTPVVSAGKTPKGLLISWQVHRGATITNYHIRHAAKAGEISSIHRSHAAARGGCFLYLVLSSSEIRCVPASAPPPQQRGISFVSLLSSCTLKVNRDRAVLYLEMRRRVCSCVFGQMLPPPPKTSTFPKGFLPQKNE